jgi:RNA recognition motif-containing protein
MVLERRQVLKMLVASQAAEDIMKNLYVGNLPHNTTEPKLRTLFERHGKVERVNIVTDKETGRPKGFAFVEMAEAVDADKACVALSGREFDGRALRVNEAKDKSR